MKDYYVVFDWQTQSVGFSEKIAITLEEEKTQITKVSENPYGTVQEKDLRSQQKEASQIRVHDEDDL